MTRESGKSGMREEGYVGITSLKELEVELWSERCEGNSGVYVMRSVV